MKHKYLVRLDDACPTMDRLKWKRIENILDEAGVKPMVGVIPHNEDIKHQIDPTDDEFWNKAKRWNEKGWAVALHGYNHVYQSFDGGGLNSVWKKSEFSGVSLDEQKDKIRKGIELLKEHGIIPKYFFAPSHTFDENTLNALREESEIRIISDTIAVRPYRYKDFVFIPQFSGSCREIKFPGLYTFCLHPNVMSDVEFEQTASFLKAHREEFTSFDALDLSNVRNKSIIDKLISLGYFTYRKIRKL